MDREVAQVIATTGARVITEIQRLVPFLKFHGQGPQDEAVLQVIATAIKEVEVMQQTAFDQHPDLKAQFEARARKYGRSSY